MSGLCFFGEKVHLAILKAEKWCEMPVCGTVIV